ncbi:hypothetical protein DFH07DRAFT_967039 [Mycena maculata]|uniref:Uncharacterized protein n=1 Tax=Mycena maculata TaxID=230809 RepID=A0AAD7I7I6_9AGAR|nr:hypothetical protein DFH07DRAFT_967039 [Mycena maculata]
MSRCFGIFRWVPLALHRNAEKVQRASQVKVLVGSGNSGKPTILKQMCLIHRVPFTPAESESYCELVWENIIRGLG